MKLALLHVDTSRKPSSVVVTALPCVNHDQEFIQ